MIKVKGSAKKYIFFIATNSKQIKELAFSRWFIVNKVVSTKLHCVHSIQIQSLIHSHAKSFIENNVYDYFTLFIHSVLRMASYR